MRAIVYNEYGPPDVLQLQEVEQPTPKAGELLIKNYATSVNFGDIMARDFRGVSPSDFTMPFPLWVISRAQFGFNRPRNPILGSEFAGEVAAVGRDVTRFRPGEQVFGYSGASMRAYAEYLCVSADGTVAAKPANVTFTEAAVVPYGAITALNLLKRADIQRGQRVLINGASGSIGSAAVQLAKHSGAHVTGVCSAPRVALVESLGADEVIDYTQENFDEGDETYDLIFDVLGKSSFARCKRVLAPNGRYLLASFKMRQLGQMLWTSLSGTRKVVCALSMESADDLVHIGELIEAGVFRAAIDREFPLEQAADAHRYVESGQKKGQIALLVAQTGDASAAS